MDTHICFKGREFAFYETELELLWISFDMESVARPRVFMS